MRRTKRSGCWTTARAKVPQSQPSKQAGGRSSDCSVACAQSVADPGFGEQELRAFGIEFDLLADLTDIDPQILRVREFVPEFLEQEAVGQHLPGMLHQHA